MPRSKILLKTGKVGRWMKKNLNGFLGNLFRKKVEEKFKKYAVFGDRTLLAKCTRLALEEDYQFSPQKNGQIEKAILQNTYILPDTLFWQLFPRQAKAGFNPKAGKIFIPEETIDSKDFQQVLSHEAVRFVN